MFIRLQLPFVDVRPFLRYPLRIVPVREENLSLEITDLEQIAKNEYVRCFGHYQLRNYIPEFRKARKKYKYEDSEQWAKLESIWQDEYLYASTRRGIRFEQLEKQALVNGKLINPRAKVRALRYFPFNPGNKIWSPCMRIETGILYDVTAPLNEIELTKALTEFVKMKVNVPVYTRGVPVGDGANKTMLHKDTLIEQQRALAKLIVNGTTAHHELRVSGDMVIPGDPLLTVHYTKDEIYQLPSTITSLPKTATGNIKIDFLPLVKPLTGAWLFELPGARKKGKIKTERYESIRNNTVAIMRYWSEFQALINLRNAVSADSFDFYLKENKRLQDYLNSTTKFLLSGKWHGVRLDFIRNIINAYQEADPQRQKMIDRIIREFPRQIAEKILKVGNTRPSIFVSYSHLDKEYLPLVKTAFKRLGESFEIGYFDDTRIKAGEEWMQKIVEALGNASLAVLLISPGFLQSDFIKNKERPVIEDRFKRGKLNIISILVEGEIPGEDFLSGLQFINGNDPLSTSTEEKKQEVMASLLERVRAMK
jgi:TIR domain